MDCPAFVAVEAALWAVRRKEVIYCCRRVSNCGFEAGSFGSELGGRGFLDWEGRGNGIGSSISFDEVAAFDVRLEVEAGDYFLDLRGFCGVGRGDESWFEDRGHLDSKK